MANPWDKNSIAPEALSRRQVLFAASLGLLVAGGVLFLVRHNFPYFNKNSVDGYYYATLAKNLVDGRGYTIGGLPHVVFHPLYPLLVSLFYLISSNLEWAAFLVNLLSLALSGILAYAFFKLIFKRRDLSLWGMLFVLFSPDLLRYGSLMVTEVTYCAALLALLYLTLRITDERQPNREWLFYGLWGLNAGAAYLIKPESIGYLLALGVFLALRQGNLKSIKYLGAAAVVVMFCCLPWMLYQARYYGSFVFSGKSAINLEVGALRGRDPQINVARIFNAPLPDGSGVAWEKPYRMARRTSLADNFAAYPAHLRRHLGYFCGLLGGGAFLFLLGLLHFYRRERRLLWFVGLLMAVQLVIPFYFSEPRFIVPLIPLLLAAEFAGGLQLAAAADWLATRLNRRPINASLLLAFILLAVIAPWYFYQYPKIFRLNPTSREYHLLLQEYARAVVQEHPEIKEQPIVSYRPWFAYYAGAEHREMPYYTAPGPLIEYMRRNRLSYLLLSNVSQNDLSLNYRELGKNPSARGLETIYDRKDFRLLKLTSLLQSPASGLRPPVCLVTRAF